MTEELEIPDESPGSEEQAPEETRLLFVYNADHGPVDTLFDMAHKIFSPGTYQCNLCKITHGHFTMKEEWKQASAKLPHPVVYLHRDEYRGLDQCPKTDLPVVLLQTPSYCKVLLSAGEINDVTEPAKLFQMIREILGQRTRPVS